MTTSIDRAKAHVVMHFADGATIDTWNALELRDSFTDPLGSLTFEAQPIERQWVDYKRRLAKGEKVTVLINGVSQGGFLIQTVNRKIGKRGGKTIRVTCHTPLVTPYQGHVDPDLDLSYPTDVSVEETIFKALGPYGFNAVITDAQAHASVISGRQIGSGKANPLATELKPKLKHSAAKAHENEAAYQFVTRIITRLGVVMRLNFDGALLVGAPNYTQPSSYTVAQTGRGVDADYFIEDVDIHDSNDDQFSECTIRGQRPDTGATSTNRPVATVLETEIHPQRPSYKSTAAPYKPKILRDKNSRDASRAKAMGTFELGVRALNAFHVTGEVHGFVARTGAIWTVDTIARVIVDAEELDEEMYLLERTLYQDRQGGQRTRLKFIPKGALVLGDPPGAKG